MQLKNPILPGFYPDPSICRRGDDLYMVTSTFEYFPGVPVFHSRDMVHWRQIDHCLTRPEQLNLDGVAPSRGIYAPTIRYHEGKKRFYMITTLVQDTTYANNINFFVTATNPAGPWSDPVVIEGAEGIDPTLFFDDDQAYYLGNMRPHPEKADCTDRWIWLQPMDLETGKLTGEKQILLRDGAFRGAATPEGPHLYHIGEWYYLMIAEGGTSWNHAETIFRSHSLQGPWESNPRNPLITHRHLSKGAAIDSTGHADLLQLPNGEWWAVLLACRPWEGKWRMLGRETFAVPVVWEDGWPVFSPSTGCVEQEYPAPVFPSCVWKDAPARDDFDHPALRLCWNTLRTPRSAWYSLTERPGWLHLTMRPVRLGDNGNPSLLLRRVQHHCYQAATHMDFTHGTPGEAGIVLMMNEAHYIALLRRDSEVCILRRNGKHCETIGALPCTVRALDLRVECCGTAVRCSMCIPGETWRPIGAEVDGTCLTVESAGGFTGAYVGLFAFAPETTEEQHVDFNWFDYRALHVQKSDH